MSKQKTSTERLLDAVQVRTGPASPDAAVIWLHGLGADGHDFAPVIPQLKLDDLNIQYVFPHAPKRPVAINNNMVMPAWFDIDRLDDRLNADQKGIEESQEAVYQWIEALSSEHNIPTKRIMLIGFSQGGALALHSGLNFKKALAGVMALSAFLPTTYPYPNAGKEAAEIWMGHGTRDSIVHLKWGQQSAEKLSKLGFQCRWKEYPMEHSVCIEELQDMGNWIRQRLA